MAKNVSWIQRVVVDDALEHNVVDRIRRDVESM